MEKIEITIKAKHFRNASGFMSNMSCPLALACQEHFSNGFVTVGTDIVNVWADGHYKGDEIAKYELNKDWLNITPGLVNGNNDTVDRLIKKAKQKKKVGSFKVILTKA